MGVSAVVTVLAIASSVSGLALLYLAWKRREQSRTLPLLAGWVLIILSAVVLALSTGVDRAIALGILVLIVLATGFLVNPWRWREDPQPLKTRDGAGALSRPLGLSIARNTAIILLAGPLAMIASLAIMTGSFSLVELIGWSRADQLALALILFPLAWACLASITVLNARLRVRSSILLAILILAGFASFVSQA